MIIETRWFSFQAPRRADLSGRPFGFLIVWFGRAGRPMETTSRFDPYSHKGTRVRTFGMWLPIELKFPRLKKTEPFECIQFVDTRADASQDWHEWPEQYRKASEAAVAHIMFGRPGRKILRDVSACDRRIDLSGAPLQLWRAIEVE